MTSVVLTVSSVSADPAGPQLGAEGDHFVTGSSVEAEARRPARTTTANAIARPDFTITACPEMTDSVLRLYSAYFLRAPDEEGFDFWTLENSLGTWSMPRMSAFFSESPEFIDLYGALTDAEFINLLYNNILGRDADAGGSTYWLNRMTVEGLDRGTVMLFFSESPEYIELTETSTPLAGEFAWYPEGTTWQCGFGAADVPIPSAAFVDIVVYNDLDRIIQLSIREQINGVFVTTVNAPVQAKAYYVFFGVPSANTGVTALRMTANENFFWIMVYAPIPTPQVREGWVQI